VLNMLAIGLVYLALAYLTNRFWAASGLILAICAVIAIIERFKVRARYEAVLPSDLDFLHGCPFLCPVCPALR